MFNEIFQFWYLRTPHTVTLNATQVPSAIIEIVNEKTKVSTPD